MIANDHKPSEMIRTGRKRSRMFANGCRWSQAVANVVNIPNVLSIPNVSNVQYVSNAPNISNVPKVPDVPNVSNVPNGPYVAKSRKSRCPNFTVT